MESRLKVAIKSMHYERVLVETPKKDNGRPSYFVWFIEDDGALSSAHLNLEEQERAYGPWTGAGGM